MPATILVPQSVDYQGPLVPLPSLFNIKNPAERESVISANLLWNDAIAVGLAAQKIPIQNKTTGVFSQIGAVFVDNSHCGVDVQLIAPDRQTSITVPAFETALVPFNTGGTDIYVSAPGCAATDATFVQIYNHYPKPVALSVPLITSVAAVQGTNAAANGTTPFVAAPTNGVLTGLMLDLQALTGGGAAGFATVTIQDGQATPAVLYRNEYSIAAGAVVNNYKLCELTGLGLRFKNGINIVIAVIAAINTALLSAVAFTHNQ